MKEESSITNWMGQLKEGNSAAADAIWDHFFSRLVEFARGRLRGTPTAISDEEDVALSVLKSVCIGIRSGRFADLENSESLWRLLLVVCGRKISNHRSYLKCAKRDARQAVSIDSEDYLISLLISQDPGPELAAELAENLSLLISSLERQELKEVAILKMQGFTNEEIGSKQGWSLSTVERKLRTIRSLWTRQYETV